MKLDLHISFLNTKFTLLSSQDYDSIKLASISEANQEFIENKHISLAIVESEVSFECIHFEGKFRILIFSIMNLRLTHQCSWRRDNLNSSCTPRI